MGHRPLYSRKSSNCGFKVLLALLLVGAGLYYFYQKKMVFHPQELVENSVLNNRSFSIPVQEIRSPKYGIQAYLLEDKSNPIISVSFLFKNAGYASDNPNEQGIANMMASLLTDGAGDLDSQAFKEEMESNAIGISFSAGKDDFSGALLTTNDNQKKAYELLRLALSEPRFDADDIRRVQAELLESLKRQKEHPGSILGLEFSKELYGKHPYARNPIGVAENILKVDKGKLQVFMADYFSRQNLLVGIAGDITPFEAEQMLDSVFGVLAESGRVNFVREAELDFNGRSRTIEMPAGQNIVMKAAAGVGRNHEDFYPLFVANHILGGSGLSSRLSQAIREKEGLTYGVYSYLVLDDKAPVIMASFSSTADKYARAEELFAEQWQNFGRNGVSAEELAQAKDYLVASYNLRFASIASIADILTAMQKYNLGLDFLQKRNDYVQQVTQEQVNNAARKYFNKDKLVSVSIGSFKGRD